MRRRKAFDAMAVIGNSLPRQCGIATFTTDMANALSENAPHATCSTIAMTDVAEGYDYPPQVRFEIAQNQLLDYRQAAEFLNVNHYDVVFLQHEYGIFGGQSGSHIIRLIDELHMPVITVLHTILKDPTPVQKDVLREVCRLSDKVVSMSRKGIEFLKQIYNVPEEKVAFVHHGIPDMPFVDPNFYKDLFGVEGKKVMLTFGLLSPGKGVENVIQALPKIVEKHPDVAYIILGATHPHVKKKFGESYRLELQQMAKKLGVDEHVIFQNRFVDIDELCEFLGCADAYVTPYKDEAQIVSGTLAYAMGAGKAIVSTPYWYAKEMLDEERGRLVPFDDPDAIAEQVNDLLDNDVERHAIRKRAYSFTREAVWSEVGRQYLEIFEDVHEARMHAPRPVYFARTAKMDAVDLADLPDLKLDHLMRMTDDTGIFQHAKYTVPDREHGYCTDDNARALIVSVLANQFSPGDRKIEDLNALYLAFLRHAFNRDKGCFRNFMAFDRTWLEEEGSTDSHARALWSLGVAVGYLQDLGLVALASNLFHRALPATLKFQSVHSLAFSLVGIHAYLRRYSGDRDARKARETLAMRLFEKWKANATKEWPWPVDSLTWGNAKLPHALVLSGQWMQHPEMIEMGLESLKWLIDQDMRDGHFSQVGNRGWHPRDGERARFDQQPIEAHATIEACLEAYNVTSDEVWLQRAMVAFNWFLGQNDFQVAIYDDRTGGCCDGLEPDGVNLNQGAESTLAWLLSLAMLRHFQSEHVLVSRNLTTETKTLAPGLDSREWGARVEKDDRKDDAAEVAETESESDDQDEEDGDVVETASADKS